MRQLRTLSELDVKDLFASPVHGGDMRTAITCMPVVFDFVFGRDDMLDPTLRRFRMLFQALASLNW